MSIVMTLSRRAIVQGLAAGVMSTLIPSSLRAFAYDGFAQGVAEAIQGDPALSAFYRGRGFEGIWAVREGAGRLQALVSALLEAPVHGLPQRLFDPRILLAQLDSAQTPYDLGRLDVEVSRMALAYGQALHGGMIVPRLELIKRRGPELNGEVLLQAMAQGSVAGALKDVIVQDGAYARLMAARGRLLQMQAAGGWGPSVDGGKFTLGESGARVVALRDRLMLQGYMAPSLTRSYEGALIEAVRRFQAAHGLTVDGVAGAGTLAALNMPLETRLSQVLVALERSRWNNGATEGRHIWVNLTDYSTQIREGEDVVFETRSVIGATDLDRQTPEFSDRMSFAVVNPSWTVPRSIVTKEYLPQLQRNAHAVSGIDLIDSRGRVVDRNSVNFAAYDARSFPFGMRQPPSARNSLGLVKYMFPNQWNIYLHDTPSKDLFNREARAFSHGCIRLADPFAFGHVLFAPELSNPQSHMQQKLDTGRETRINLETPVPVHLDYRTAFVTPDGALQFRGDVYHRDEEIWRQMTAAGVEIGLS